MPQYNSLNLPGIDQAAQGYQANAFRLQQAEKQASRADTEYDDATKLQNTRFLAGATKVLMDIYDKDPDRFYAAADELGKEGIERGIIDPERWDPQLVTIEQVRELHDQARVGMGGQPINDLDSNLPARVRTAQYYSGLTEEGKEDFRHANSATKGMKTIKVPMQDGTELMVNYDPETGRGFDLATGSELIVRPGGGGEPLVYGNGGLMGAGTPAQLPEGFGRSADPVEQREDMKRAEVGVTEEIKREKIVSQQLTAVENAHRLQPMMQAAMEGANAWTTGWGSYLALFPGTEAKSLSVKIETIKANIGFDRLQRMRAESPTGGALGQVAVQELVALQSTIANLDTSQDDEDFKQNMQVVMQQYNSWLRAWGEAIMKDGTRDQKMRYYETVPSGARFMHPDGSWRIKP